MRPPPLRVRLTGWYLLVIFTSLALYSVAMYFGLRHAIEDTVDHQLEARAADVEAFLKSEEHNSTGGDDAQTGRPRADKNTLVPALPSHPRQLPASSPGEPRDDLYQITDAGGTVVYQSAAMENLRIPVEPTQRRNHYRHHRDSGNFTTYYHKGGDVRVLSSTIQRRGGDYRVQVAAIVSPLYEVLERFQAWALTGLPVTLCLAGLGGYWLSGRALRPVRSLVLATRTISERQLAQRLNLPAAQDELHELASTINGMLGRLESAFTRLTRFTADASHELRTPVAVIRTTSEVALEQERSPEEYKDMMRQILLEAESTSTLIEQLLTLARADADTLQMTFEPLDLRDLIAQLEQSCRLLAERSGLQWSSEIPSDPIIVLGDRAHLRRLILVLVENACRYTKRGGSVSLSLQSTSLGPCIEVADTGIGIQPQDYRLVFERFYRAANARFFAPEGTGLGLSIALWIASAHEGSLIVANSSTSGTCMRFCLSASR